MTLGQHPFARAGAALPLLPVLALLAACQSMPEVPFMGKKNVPPPTVDSAPNAMPAMPAPAPATAGKLPEPPASPAPAARTAVLGTTYSIDGAILPVVRGQQLVETRADMRRTDSLQGFDNRLLRSFSGDSRSANIVRLDKKLLWTLNADKKTYTECPLTGCRPPERPSRDKPPQPDRPSKPEEPSCPLTLKKNELKATPTGERKAINSFNTERIQVTWLMEMADKQGRVTSNRVLLDLWTTPETGVVKEVQAIDQTFSKRWASALATGDNPFGRYVPREVMGSMAALMGNMGVNSKAMAGWANEFKKVRGYPILTTLSWSAEGNACADERGGAGAPAPTAASMGAMMGGLFGGKGKAGGGGGGGPLLSYTHEVKTMEVRPVSDAWFAPAADFQKVQ